MLPRVDQLRIGWRDGFVVGGFDFAVRLRVFLGTMVEQRVGQRTADALVEQYQHQGNAGAFSR
jgi:hypothetical protein